MFRPTRLGRGAPLVLGAVLETVLGCGSPMLRAVDGGAADGANDDEADAVSPDVPDSSPGPDDAAMDLAADTNLEGSVPQGPPFPTVIRIVNDGASDHHLNYYPDFACPLGLEITGPASPIDQPTSIEGSATLCPCASCQPGAARSPICSTVDLVCDVLAPIVIPSGGAYDFPWDGTVTVWRSDLPACTRMCSETFTVPAGDGYRFSLTEFGGLASGTAWQTDAPLPAPGGVVAIHVH